MWNTLEVHELKDMEDVAFCKLQVDFAPKDGSGAHSFMGTFARDLGHSVILTLSAHMAKFDIFDHLLFVHKKDLAENDPKTLNNGFFSTVSLLVDLSEFYKISNLPVLKMNHPNCFTMCGEVKITLTAAWSNLVQNTYINISSAIQSEMGSAGKLTSRTKDSIGFKFQTEKSMVIKVIRQVIGKKELPALLQGIVDNLFLVFAKLAENGKNAVSRTRGIVGDSLLQPEEPVRIATCLNPHRYPGRHTHRRHLICR